MPTLMLTSDCPNSCPWCFARSAMSRYQKAGIREISWEDFLEAVDFLKRSGVGEIILLGGEPTRHSRFMDILAFLDGEHLDVFVSTNGIMPKTLAEDLGAFISRRVSFGLNSTSYFRYDSVRRSKVDHFLASVGRRVSLSYTITEMDIDYPRLEPMLDRLGLIMKYSLRPHIQFQIAVPSPGSRFYIPFERTCEVVTLLEKWWSLLDVNRVRYGLDCHSLPKCAWPSKRSADPRYSFRCEKFMIDIGPDLQAWPCFPLSNHSVRLSGFDTISHLRDSFKTRLSEYAVFDHSCGECEDRVRACSGGCYGYWMTRRP